MDISTEREPVHTLQVFGVENLQQEPDEKQKQDPLYHSLTAEQHTVPCRLQLGQILLFRALHDQIRGHYRTVHVLSYRLLSCVFSLWVSLSPHSLSLKVLNLLIMVAELQFCSQTLEHLLLTASSLLNSDAFQHQLRLWNRKPGLICHSARCRGTKKATPPNTEEPCFGIAHFHTAQRSNACHSTLHGSAGFNMDTDGPFKPGRPPSRRQDHTNSESVDLLAEEVEFPTFNLAHKENNDILKLVKGHNTSNIYAGAPHSLYVFKVKSEEMQEKEHELASIYDNACQSPSCMDPITLLTEGKNENPLLICRREKQCCEMTREDHVEKCFGTPRSSDHVKEAALYTGDSLYYTVSGENNAGPTLGLYSLKRPGGYTWPQSREIARRHIKIIANESAQDGKLYNFYIEKNTSENPETPSWIPRVSQYCMADTGGSKNQLQYRWTSMLTTRLFCGNKKKRQTFTELLDVAQLDPKNWDSTMIYALFKNDYNMSAVCVYNMSEIIRIFASSKFKTPPESGSSGRAGECVSEKEKTPSFLKFMESRPEMQEWIEPERGPLLISHRQYTHLQVDAVTDRNNVQRGVLLLTSGDGKVHKVLEQDDGPFVVAEYHPFENKTHVHSTLLDRSTKKLYVISSRQLVQIDLQNCSIYEKQCDACVNARDPYCVWSESKCSPGNALQDVRTGSNICQDLPSARVSTSDRTVESPLIVPPDSKYYLKCPTPSQHASYSWTHDGRPVDCLSTKQECVLLIEKMSERDQGLYNCKATENGQERTVMSYRLENSASQLSRGPVMLACLLLLLSLVCF
ncbi:hypothetical protein NFI96_016779 [Prochilodus magdalenae]|nr:hypothetical protein NFI96_016779 [Prochilodus magdalenae]